MRAGGVLRREDRVGAGEEPVDDDAGPQAPEQRHDEPGPDHDRQPWGQAPAEPRHRELPEQAHPAPGEQQQQGDAERHRHDHGPDQGRGGRHPEHRADLVLPAHEPPAVPDRAPGADADEHPQRHGSRAAAQARDAEVAPQRGGPGAQPVADRDGHTRHQALQPGGPREEGGDERRGEEPGGRGEPDPGQHPVEHPLRAPERGHQGALPHAQCGGLDERDGHDAPCWYGWCLQQGRRRIAGPTPRFVGCRP